MECVNCVATFRLYTPLDLQAINGRFPTCTYRSSRFTSLIMKREHPTPFTCLIFATGNCVITGLRMTQHIYPCIKEVGSLLEAGAGEMKIRNLVYRHTFDVSLPLRLTTLQEAGRRFYAHGYRFDYEPELFPGMHIRAKDERACILIFTSGKLLLTGLKEESELIRYVNFLDRLAQRYRQHVRSTAAAQTGPSR